MQNWSLYDRAAATIPFQLNGYTGTVSVYYGVNDDSRRVGFDSLPGLSFDISKCHGYPVMHARIESYEGTGYRTLCAWIQVVTNVYLDAHDREPAGRETLVSMDVPPAFQEFEIPFASYGTLPQLMDAPCMNLGSHTELRWTADTFLTTLPLRSRDEEIAWLAGFRWGYTENNLPDQKPVLLPLEVTGPAAWAGHADFLQENYGKWGFKRS